MEKTPFIQTMKNLGQAPSVKNKVWAIDVPSGAKSKKGSKRSSSVPPPSVAMTSTKRSSSIPPNPSKSSVENEGSLGNNGSGDGGINRGRSSTPRSITTTTGVKSKNGSNRSSSVFPIPLPSVATQPTKRSLSVAPNPSSPSLVVKGSLGNNSTTKSTASMGTSGDANAKDPTIADFGFIDVSKKKEKYSTLEVMETSISKPTEPKKLAADDISNEKNGGLKPTSFDDGSDFGSMWKSTSSEEMATSFTKPTEQKKREKNSELKPTSSTTSVQAESKLQKRKKVALIDNTSANINDDIDDDSFASSDDEDDSSDEDYKLGDGNGFEQSTKRQRHNDK